MAGWLAALGSAAGGSSGGLTQAYTGRQMGKVNQRWNREMMARQQAWSAKRYQTSVADMKAAGLNPILAASGGQPAPGVAQPAGKVGPGAGTSFDPITAKKVGQEGKQAKLNTDLAQKEWNYLNTGKGKQLFDQYMKQKYGLKTAWSSLSGAAQEMGEWADQFDDIGPTAMKAAKRAKKRMEMRKLQKELERNKKAHKKTLRKWKYVPYPFSKWDK